MSDFYAPPSGSSVPDGLSTLNNLMSLKQRQQGLQSGAIGIQQQQTELQGAQQTQKQRKALASYDYSKHIDSGGLLDTSSLAQDKDLRTAAGDLYPEVLQQANAVRQGQIQNKKALFNLSQEQLGAGVQLATGLKTDPDVIAGNAAGKQKVLNAFTQGGQSMGIDPQVTAPIIGQLEKVDATKIPTALQMLQLQMQDVSKQMQTTAPGGASVQGKRGLNVVNTNPYAPQPVGSQVGQPITDQGIAPTLATMPSGSLSVVGPSGPGGAAQGPTGSAPGIPHPRTAQQDAPPPNAPRAVQEAFQSAVKTTNEHVDSVRTADENYGNNKAISAAIRHLSANADTGPGTGAWNNAMAFLHTDAGNNAQELGAFLDRQAATIRGQMGLPGTNAGAEDSKSIVGNTKYTPKVIQDKNDYTEALTEGLHQYRNGLDRIAGFGGQASPAAVNAFKSAWTQNFDPNVFKGEMAFKRSAKEGKEFVASLDPQEAASLSEKRAKLKALASGQIPQ